MIQIIYYKYEDDQIDHHYAICNGLIHWIPNSATIMFSISSFYIVCFVGKQVMNEC